MSRFIARGTFFLSLVFTGCHISPKTITINSSSSQSTYSQFTVSVSSSTIQLLNKDFSATEAISIARNGSKAFFSISVDGLPEGIESTVTNPGVGNAGNIILKMSKDIAGTYPINIKTSDGVKALTTPLTLELGVTHISVQPTVIANFNESMSTSLPLASWEGLFGSYPSLETALDRLQPQHIRLQTYRETIPQIGPDLWDFSKQDLIVQPVLRASDHSPELQLCDAPSFMFVPGTKIFSDQTYHQFATYAQNQVRYYNLGGFTSEGGKHVSSSTTPILWWGIYNEPEYFDLTPQQYVQMYNVIVPAMKAVDSRLKFVALEVASFSNALQEYLPAFVSGVQAPVDAVAIHLYSSINRLDSDASIMATVPKFGSSITYVYSQMKKNPQLANVPIWITENNVNADYAGADGMSHDNPKMKFAPDPRGSDAFFAAWRSYVFSVAGKANAGVLYQWDFVGDEQYGEVNQISGASQLSYWVDYWIGHYFSGAQSSRSQILQLMNSDTDNVEGLAIRDLDGSVTILISNHAVASSTDNDGRGIPRLVQLDIGSLGNFSSATNVIIDSNTNIISGPIELPVSIAQQMQFVLNGYGFVLLKLKP